MGSAENLGKDRISFKHNGVEYKAHLLECYGDTFKVRTECGKHFKLKKVSTYLHQKMFKEGHAEWMEFEEV